MGKGSMKMLAMRHAWLASAAVIGAYAGIMSVALAAEPASPQGGVSVAQAAQRLHFDIPAQSLNAAVLAYAQRAGVQVFYDAARLRDLQSQPLAGDYTPDEALGLLLSGTGVSYRFTGASAVTLERDTASGAGVNLPTVTVEAQVANPNGTIGNLPPDYAGGQVARGGRLGLLGNRDVMDTPFNITNYTAQTIEDQQARTVADVIANDPSVRMVAPISNGSEVMTIRGFTLANQDVAFDGLYGIVPFWKGSVASAERVEVMKGPNALLNGMAPGGNIGGGINIVPKRAGDEPLTRFTGSYISDSNFGGHADIGQRFGVDKEFGVRVNGLFRDGDSGRTNQEHGEATLALDYRGERTRLTFDLGYQQQDYVGVEGLLLPGAGLAAIPKPPDASKSYYQPWTYWENQGTYAVARGEFDITPDVTAYAAVGGRNYTDEFLLPFGSGLNAAGNMTESFAFSADYYNTRSSEAGVRARAETGPVRHQLSAGVTVMEQESGTRTKAVPAGFPNPSNIYNPNIRPKPDLGGFLPVPKTAELNLTSFAIADTLSIFDNRAQLMLGGRQQRVAVDGFSPTTGLTTTSYDKDAFTPVVGLVLKPWDNVSFYGNYIEGLTQGQTAPGTTVNAGQIFAPYLSEQREVGVKVDHGTFATTMSLFEITKPNGITNPITNVFSVDGEQRNRGIEVNTFGEPWKGIRLMGGVMTIDAEQTKTQGGINQGKTATNVPDWQVNLGTEWDTPFDPKLTLTARMIYTSSLYVDAANTLMIPDWTRFDIGARYKFDTPSGTPVTVNAIVENVFDANYWMSASLYRGSPRMFLVSTTFDF